MSKEFIERQRIDGEVAVDRFGSYSIEIDGEQLVGPTFRKADLNGNGFMDLVVGAAFHAGDPNEDIGRVYVFFNDGTGRFNGGATLNAANADIIINGENEGDFFGGAIEIADINGDGSPDIIIGAPGVDVEGSLNIGEVYIFFNDGNGNFATDAQNADLVIVGENQGDEFGSALNIADFTGEGRVDLVVGAPFVDTLATDGGAVYIFFNQGSPNFFENNAVNADEVIIGEQVNEYFGIKLRPVDINSDGNIDLIVGSPLWNAIDGGDEGRVYIFLNDGSGGFPDSSNNANETIEGEQPAMNFGQCISAGDLNEDGSMDLIVGAPHFDPPDAPDDAGALFIFFNSGNPGDLFPESTSNANQRIDGDNFRDAFGTSCIIADIDKNDILVGAPRFSVPINGVLENGGAVYLFLNDGSGFFPASASGADLRIDSTSANDRFGSGIITGDFDNNTLTDLIIGARLADFNQEDSGSVFIYNQQAIPRRPGCDKFEVERVICDELFYIEDDEVDIPIGEIVVPEGSSIGGTVEVTIMNCEPIVDIENDEFRIKLTFMVQKELIITTPDQETIPLEFGAPLSRELSYRKCIPSLIGIPSEELENISCQIISVAGRDEISLNTGEIGAKDATFTEELTIAAKIKLIQKKDEIIPLCSEDQEITIDIIQSQESDFNND